MAVIKDDQHDAHPFFIEVRRRSEAMLKASGKTRFGGKAQYWKTTFWFGIYRGFYVLIVSDLLPFPFSFMPWMVFGFLWC